MCEGAAPGSAAQGVGALRSIQILRAVASLGVLAHHAASEVAQRTGVSVPFNNIVVGAGGVDLFFVISGFVMVYASETLFGQPGAPRVFFLRRLARIVPLYWAATLILLAAFYALYRVMPPPFISTEGVFLSFLFWPHPRPDGVMEPLHSLGWTLNYEMFFYAVFAAAILLTRRIAVLTVAVAFAALVTVGLVFKLPQPLAFWSDPIILEFCFGMLIAALYREGLRLPPAASFALVVAAIAAYLGSAVWGPALPWRALEWGLPGAALIAAFALARDALPPGPVARALIALGDASYSLYLVHAIVFPIVRRVLLPWLGLPLGPWIYALILITTSIAVAVASYRWFERPMTRALQNWIGGPGSFRSRPARAR